MALPGNLYCVVLMSLSFLGTAVNYELFVHRGGLARRICALYTVGLGSDEIGQKAFFEFSNVIFFLPITCVGKCMFVEKNKNSVI